MRNLLRVTAITATIALTAVLASPAFAGGRDDGDDPGPGMTMNETLLWFVAVPFAIIAVIWLAVSVASWAKSPRYRPGVSWAAKPVWINGPTAPLEPAKDVKALMSGALEMAAPVDAPAAATGGGARARW